MALKSKSINIRPQLNYISEERLCVSQRFLNIGGQRLLFTGGDVSNNILRTQCFLLDAITEEIIEYPALSIGRKWHSMAWIDGNPAVVGGKTMNNDTQSVEILKASKWIEDSPINVPRNSHISVTISQGVWTLGGLFNKMRLVSIENYKNHAWSVVVLVLPIPWSDILACSLGNNLLLLGGKTTSNIVTDMVIYISTDVFSITQLAPLKTPASFQYNSYMIESGLISSAGRNSKHGWCLIAYSTRDIALN